jgi:hypothetical protein
MALAINNFISSMSKAKGFARPSQYAVQLNLPPALTNIQRSFGPQLTLHCDSVSMPGHDLQSATAKFGTAVATEMVTGHAYAGTVDATFYLDQELDVKAYFDAWQESAISTTRNTVSYYKTDGKFNYVGSMQIFQLGSKSSTQTKFQFNSNTGFSQNKKTHSEAERVYGINVEEVFPATIGAIEYAYATNNTVVKISVEFSYRQWFNMTSDTIAGYEGSNLFDLDLTSYGY